jgi:hypothetical protein
LRPLAIDVCTPELSNDVSVRFWRDMLKAKARRAGCQTALLQGRAEHHPRLIEALVATLRQPAIQARGLRERCDAHQRAQASLMKHRLAKR